MKYDVQIDRFGIKFDHFFLSFETWWAGRKKIFCTGKSERNLNPELLKALRRHLDDTCYVEKRSKFPILPL